MHCPLTTFLQHPQKLLKQLPIIITYKSKEYVKLHSENTAFSPDTFCITGLGGSKPSKEAMMVFGKVLRCIEKIDREKIKGVK